MDDNELLRTLAKKTGWEVIPGEGGVYAVVCKDRTYDYAYSEAEAWETLGRDAPPWCTSVDAALALPWPKDHVLDMSVCDGFAYAELRKPLAPHSAENTVTRPTLARALCEVFAQWAVAQEAKEGKR